MTDDTAGASFPRTVMGAVIWSFRGGERFTDPAEFERRVREYYMDIMGEDIWLPHQVALSAPRVRITYFGLSSPDAAEYTDFVADLQSEDGARFTAGELLLKLNNAVAPHMEEADHCYFEGLVLSDTPPADGVPVYEMRQGS
jgi:hypothetical protein